MEQRVKEGEGERQRRVQNLFPISLLANPYILAFRGLKLVCAETAGFTNSVVALVFGSISSM